MLPFKQLKRVRFPPGSPIVTLTMQSIGKLNFSISETHGHRLVVDVDSDIARFARSLIPRFYDVRIPKYPPHISLVRGEQPNEKWGLRHGQEVEFEYYPGVYNDSVYWWMRVGFKNLREIREELGLAPSSKITRPPDGFDCFHITIGNMKP